MAKLPSEVNRYLQNAKINPEEFNSQERLVLNKILSELEKTGDSNMLKSLWMEDYEEIPVSIDRFISDENYIGSSTNNGKDIYPFWKNMLRKVFNGRSEISEVILSGAIGVGKSSIACIGETYTIYKLLCLRDPSRFYNLISTDSPAIALFNITLDKGYGVAYKKIQEFCINSPWLSNHGMIAGRGKVFIPDKGIKIGVGSNQDHFIGLDIFSCVAGNTIIETENGPKRIDELEKSVVRVYSLSPDGERVLSDPARIVKTKTVTSIYRIMLPNHKIISCTEDHKFMMWDGSYKQARDLVYGERLMCSNGESIMINFVYMVSPVNISVYDVINANPYNNFLIKVGNHSIVAHNCFMDEMDFADNKDVSIDQSKVYESFQAIVRRINTRFMNQGDIPGVIFLASSVRTERDFLATHLEEESNNPRTLIVREPVFNIKPSNIYSGERFKVAIGTRFTNSYIINDEEENDYTNNGFDIYEVPVEYRKDFERDINSSIRDILGVALKSSGQFILEEKVNDGINKNVKNGFKTSDIHLGFDDQTSLFDYFDLNRINHILVRLPIFVHFDLSLTGDNTGMFAHAVIETNNTVDTDFNTHVKGVANNLQFIPIFGARISPLVKGEQVPYYKLRDFVINLRDKYNLNILGISADGYQSADMLQNFRIHGFLTSQLSMDKAPSLGYKTARTALNEGRVIMLDDDFLKTELIRLQENRRTEKVDHPVVNGSKDMADAWAGSIFNAVKYNEKHPVVNITRVTIEDVISAINSNNGHESAMLENNNPSIEDVYETIESDMFNFEM